MHKKGFTLTEILVVVVIIASVAVFSIPAYQKSKAKMQYDKALGTLIELGTGLNNFYGDYQLQTGVALLKHLQDVGLGIPTQGKQITTQYDQALTGACTGAPQKPEQSTENQIRLPEFVGYPNNQNQVPTCMLQVMLVMDYLPQKMKFTNVGYDYFLCNYLTTPLSSSCCKENVVACMKASTGASYDWGARFMKDSSVVRF